MELVFLVFTMRRQYIMSTRLFIWVSICTYTALFQYHYIDKRSWPHSIIHVDIKKDTVEVVSNLKENWAITVVDINNMQNMTATV